MSAVLSENGTPRQPQNMRQTPEGWDAILEKAEAIIDGQPITDSAVSQAYEMVSDLPHQKIDEYRYYGIGENLCNLARSLMDSDTYAQVITDSSDKLVNDFRRFSWSPRPSGDGIYLDDLDPWILSAGLEEPVKKANEALASGSRLTTEALSIFEQRVGFGHPLDAPLDDEILQKAKEGGHTVDSIMLAALAGTCATIRAVYIAEHDPEPNSDIRITPKAIRSLHADAVSAQLASIHIDLLDDISAGKVDGWDLSEFVQQSTTGSWRLDQDAVKDVTAPNSASLHIDALSCPALHVTGLMRLVRKLVPDIIEAAESKLPDTLH